MPQTINYQFNQSFTVPPKKAYAWCTDYQPQDNQLIGETNAKREITKLTDTTLILKETFATDSGNIVKEKLVQLYPNQLRWVSTHISGPYTHSQFIYEIKPNGKGSLLRFTANHVEHKQLTKKDAQRLTEDLCKGDAHIWTLFAAAMTQDSNDKF
jgi:hypothetical protein